MKYRLQHYTAYRYTKSVSQSHSEMRMAPRNNRTQKVLSSEVFITPKPDSYFEREDNFGNHASYFNILHSHTELITHVSSIVETQDFEPIQDVFDIPWENSLKQVKQPNEKNFINRQFILPSSLISDYPSNVSDLIEKVFLPGKGIITALHDLTELIFRNFKYQPGVSDTKTHISQVLECKEGVCQDFAHVAIACLRSVGFPAQYVSGYIETLPPPGKEKFIGADASHAWFTVYVPNVGWIDFDPTNNQQTNSHYITIACGRDYADVAPLKGVVFGGGNHSMEVRVDMRPADQPAVSVVK